MKWYGNQFIDKVELQMRTNTMRAAEAIADRAWENVSKQYPPASKPGQFPARRSGNLQRNIQPVAGNASDLDEEMSAFVVSSGKSAKGFHYPTFLELHRGRLGLVTTLDQSRDDIIQIMNQSDIINAGNQA